MTGPGNLPFDDDVVLWKTIAMIAGGCLTLGLVLFSDRISNWRASRAERAKWNYWNHS